MYGSGSTKEKTLVKSISYHARIGDDIQHFTSNLPSEVYIAPMHDWSRTGSNTSRYFDLDNPDSYSVTFKKVRKKIGYKIKKRKKRYFGKPDELTGARRVIQKLEDVRVPVFVDAYKPVRQRIKRPGLNDSLFAPNFLFYESTKRWCSRSENTFTWTHGSPSSSIQQSWKVKAIGFPTNIAYMGPGVWSYLDTGGPDALLQFNYKTIDVAAFLQDEDDEALRKLYAKVASEFPSYLVDVAQSDKTVATLKKIGNTALKIIKSIKKLDISAAKGVLQGVTPKDLTDLWLEYIYGIAPTIQTINDSIALYGRESRTWRSYSTSVTKRLHEKVDTHYPGNNPDYPFARRVGTHDSQLTVRYGCVMVGNQSFSRFVRKEFSFDGAASLGYEIIPFSFMLDWVYDIGSFINSRSIFGSHLLYAWKTYFIRENVNYKYTPESNWWRKCEFEPFDVNGQYIRCLRTPLSSLPDMPAPKLKTFNEGLSLQRSVNALSIFISSFR